jgi:isopenicillin-N N-acyltransferase like protein
MPSYSDIPLIEISGTPFERGRQYGEKAAARIRKAIGNYMSRLTALGMSTSDLHEITRRFEPQIESFQQSFVEEMRGIAEGADVDYPSIVLLNARTELLKLAENGQKAKFVMPPSDGCTGVVVMPGATAGGGLIHAQNWDWHTECIETVVILRVNREAGPSFLTFTEAGTLARFGFNQRGIAITGNYLECDRDYSQVGVPLSFLRRKVLEQSSLALAMQAVYGTPKSASNNIIVSHSVGIAIDFECAPNETFQLHPKENLIVHANHFQSPVALSKLTDRGIVNSPDSLYRDIRVRDLLSPYIGSITPDHVKNALFDDFETPFSVCRPLNVKAPGHDQSATVAMIIMQPGAGILEVAVAPSINREFKTFTLDMTIQQPRKSALKIVQPSAA